MLKQVISSWEVIVVTLGFIFYVFIVNQAARSNRQRRTVKKLSFKKKKSKKPASPANELDGVLSSSNSNDELGLEES